MTSCRTTWSDLPIDLLQIVCRKLTAIFDFVAFGAVCNHWRIAFFLCKRPQVPLLILPQVSSKHTVFCFPDFSHEHVLHSTEILLPYYGSSHGWLITKGIVKGTLQLVNPFLSVNNVIQLPYPKGEILITKAILSNDPLKTSHYYVAVLGVSLGLAFFRAGDTSWTSIDDVLGCTDIAFYKDHLYAFICMNHLISWDINATIPSVKELVSFYFPSTRSEHFYDVRLVVSAEDLLCVKVFNKYSHTQVFKLGTREFEKLENLRGHVILISKFSCVSVSYSYFPNCKPDHIYFSYSSIPVSPYGSVCKLRMKVLNFVDKTIWSLKEQNIITPPVWVQPTWNLLTSTTRNEESSSSSGQHTHNVCDEILKKML